MATSGNMGRTLRGESDESFDFTCSPCVMKNRNKEATKYCLDCQDYYCSTCVEFHKDIPAMKDHTILGRSEFPKTGIQTLMSVPTERCKNHPTKLLDMFCQNEDQIGCHACMAVTHRSCVDVVYIPEEIENLMKGQDIQKIKEDLQKAKIRVEEMIQARHNDLAEVEQDRIIALGKIKDLRDKINDTLDELEKATTKEFEAKSKSINTQIHLELETIGNLVKDMEKCQQQLDSAERNPSQQFVCMKKGQQKMAEADKIIKEIAVSSGNTKFEFEQDPSIEQFLDAISSFGKVQEKADENQQVKQHDYLYQVTNKQTFDVKTSADRQTCSVLGSCILKSGTLLLADYNNNKLKQLDKSTYKVIDQCDLPASPHAVCEIGAQEVAVSLTNKIIQFISLGSRMVSTRSIKTNHTCWGLAFSNGEIFVSNENKHVYVYDASGTLVRTICKDQSGKDIFHMAYHVAVCQDGSKQIYVANYLTSVVTLDRQGKVLSHFSDPELSGAVGVCGDGCGNIFVCGHISYSVLQIGPSGNKLGVLAKQLDGIKNPLSVCFDRSTSRLIVTNQDANFITVFTLV